MRTVPFDETRVGDVVYKIVPCDSAQGIVFQIGGFLDGVSLFCWLSPDGWIPPARGNVRRYSRFRSLAAAKRRLTQVLGEFRQEVIDRSCD